MEVFRNLNLLQCPANRVPIIPTESSIQIRMKAIKTAAHIATR